MRRTLLSLLLATSLAGCAHKQRIDDDKPKLPPAKPEAVEAFKDGARLMRLGAAHHGRAVDRFEAAIALDPRLWEAHYDLGWLALESRRYEAAAKHFEKSVAIYPRHFQSILGLGRAYDASGRPDAAVRVYKNFLGEGRGKTEELAPVRVALGGSLRRAGKLDQALEILRDALKAEARSAAALTGLGLVYEAKGQHELAELVLHRAVEIDPKSKLAADIWNNLGLIALARRHDQEAFADFAEAVKIDPTLSTARRNRAVVYLDCGDYDKAANELRDVVKGDATDSAAWVALGVAERGRGKLDEAEKAYQRAIEADPAGNTGTDALDARYNLGVLYMDFKKDPAKAKDLLMEFVKAASGRHPKPPKISDAETRLKDLAPKSESTPQSNDKGSTPAPAAGAGGTLK